MKRSTIHFAVDSLALVALVAMTSTGFLLRYVLPPGSGRLLGEGTGYGAARNPITLLWGLTRQEWGSIHFWISTALMAILAVHIFLHWRWIVSVVRNRPKDHSGVRFGIGVVGLVSVLGFAMTPFLSPTRSIPRIELTDELETNSQPSIKLRQRARIRGLMTLRDVEKQTGTPVDVLLRELDLPGNISPDSHIERLSRIYGFDVEAVHEIVDRYEETYGQPAE